MPLPQFTPLNGRGCVQQLCVLKHTQELEQLGLTQPWVAVDQDEEGRRWGSMSEGPAEEK